MLQAVQLHNGEYFDSRLHGPAGSGFIGLQNGTEAELFDSRPTNVVDFELHASEETKLVIKILELAGIVIKDPNLYHLVDKEEIETLQQEKQ